MQKLRIINYFYMSGEWYSIRRERCSLSCNQCPVSPLCTLSGTRNAIQFLALTQFGVYCWSTSQPRLKHCGRHWAKNISSGIWNFKPSIFSVHPHNGLSMPDDSAYNQNRKHYEAVRLSEPRSTAYDMAFERLKYVFVCKWSYSK